MEETKGKILYVEDDLIDQMAFKRYAKNEEFPYDFDVVSSVEEAVSLVKESDFDIVITDFVLGPETAFDLIEQLPGMPFIVVTGAGDQEKAVQAMKAGAYDYLVKDNEGKHLQAIPLTVEKALKRKRDEEELENYRKHLEDLVQERTKDLEHEIEIRKKKELELKFQNEEIAALNEELTATNEALKYSNEDLSLALNKAEEADRLKNAFLANMSHEIRTPLNSILGFSSLLEPDDLAQADRKVYIDILKNSSNQLLSIISDIIDISKIEVGQLKVKEKKFYLNSLMEEIRILFETEKRAKGKHEINIVLNREFEDSKSAVISDKVRVQQVLSNLLSNALKFTENGSIEFGYEYRDEKLVFHVKDSGIGISEEIREIIFDRFRQGDESYSRKYGGTGLGLAICKGIVEILGGEIWLSSEINKGSTFSFTIPYKTPEEIEKLTKSGGEEKFAWPGRKILIVEDVFYNYKFLFELLRGTEVEIIHAEDGQQAIEMTKEHDDLNLILMDIQLPGISGYEATEQILKDIPGMPIIAQTAHAFEHDREKSLEVGCVDYISKPINKSELYQKIQQHIR